MQRKCDIVMYEPYFVILCIMISLCHNLKLLKKFEFFDFELHTHYIHDIVFEIDS